MRTLFRARIEAQLLRRAESVCERMGTTSQDAVRMFLRALVNEGRFPWTPGNPTSQDAIPSAKKRATVLDSFYDENDPNSEAR